MGVVYYGFGCILVFQILGKAEFLNPGGSVKDRVAVKIIEEVGFWLDLYCLKEKEKIEILASNFMFYSLLLPVHKNKDVEILQFLQDLQYFSTIHLILIYQLTSEFS